VLAQPPGSRPDRMGTESLSPVAVVRVKGDFDGVLAAVTTSSAFLLAVPTIWSFGLGVRDGQPILRFGGRRAVENASSTNT